MDPDSTLWARSRAGDADAFTGLFRRHSKTIYNYCFRRLGDWREAEDALSLVFLEAWRRRDTELPPDKVLPWLYGIATNVLRNRRRSQRRFRAALARLPLPSPEGDFSDASASRLDDQRGMGLALGLVAQLSPRERDVFILCAWQGLSYEDAALALGVPVGTVRSRLSRAREHIEHIGELDCRSGHVEGKTTAAQEDSEP
jgi:RNA polymerase sigma-70 factor (ECF subfamily)